MQVVMPLQWPIRAIAWTVNLTAANTPVKLMPANQARTFYLIANDIVSITGVAAGVVQYGIFDNLFISFDPPKIIGGAVPSGIIIPPGGYLQSQFGSVPRQEIWVWSPLVTVGSHTLTAYEGVNDPTFRPPATWE